MAVDCSDAWLRFQNVAITSIVVPNTKRWLHRWTHPRLVLALFSMASLVGVDVKLCSALLHRTVGGIPVGIPTVSENVFGLLPWQLEAGFHPQLLPGEKSRSWVFFCLNPPQGKYPTMGVSSFRWEKKSYFDIEVAYHNINLIRNSLFAGINGTKEEKAMCTSWGLLKYYHMGISLFCLTFQAKSSTIKRTPSAKKSKKEKKN